MIALLSRVPLKVWAFAGIALAVLTLFAAVQ